MGGFVEEIKKRVVRVREMHHAGGPMEMVIIATTGLFLTLVQS